MFRLQFLKTKLLDVADCVVYKDRLAVTYEKASVERAK